MCFLCVWCLSRDISFLCDAVLTHKKMTALPPLHEVSCVTTGFVQLGILKVLYFHIKSLKALDIQTA